MDKIFVVVEVHGGYECSYDANIKAFFDETEAHRYCNKLSLDLCAFQEKYHELCDKLSAEEVLKKEFKVQQENLEREYSDISDLGYIGYSSEVSFEVVELEIV